MTGKKGNMSSVAPYESHESHESTSGQQQRQDYVDITNYKETPEMVESAHIMAVKNVAPTNVPEINLAEEEIKSMGFVRAEDGTEERGPLTHAVVSFLTPAFGHVCTGGAYGLKIYSAHIHEEDAVLTAKRLKEYHTELYGRPIYAILVMEMGKLITIPHTKEDLNRLWKNRESSDELLNEMISNYRVEQEKGQILFNERKDTLVKSALARARELRQAAATAAVDAVDAASASASAAVADAASVEPLDVGTKEA